MVILVKIKVHSRHLKARIEKIINIQNIKVIVRIIVRPD